MVVVQSQRRRTTWSTSRFISCLLLIAFVFLFLVFWKLTNDPNEWKSAAALLSSLDTAEAAPIDVPAPIQIEKEVRNGEEDEEKGEEEEDNEEDAESTRADNGQTQQPDGPHLPILPLVNDTLAAPKAVIAYAWTLATCSDFQSSTEGMIDAALVLRHSVQRISYPYSKYGYHMYVLVHPKAAQCTKILEQAGYTVVVKEPPIDKNQIRGEYLRKFVDREWCCGSKEFIKLYAYDLEGHDVVVHVDIDFAFYRPMDELYDALLEPPNSPAQLAAQQQIVTQFPDEVKFPERIEAFITRDYQQVIPGDNATLFQAGFMVVKRNPEVLEELRQVVLKGDFVDGWNSTSGWGGLGYAGKVGAKAMQGLIAYYYDQIRPDVSVEINGCHYNWMGGDILYRNVPAFYPRKFADKVGKCRNGRETCQDCQKTPFSDIQSVHYTNCRKPWNCIGIKWAKGQAKTEQGIDERNSNYDKCMEIIQQWHLLRAELEDMAMRSPSADASQLAKQWRSGTYKEEVFRGHCHGNGQSKYIPLSRDVDPGLFTNLYN